MTHLFSADEGEYGEEYNKHFLEQYKMYLRSLDYVSDLKHRINGYFLTIHTLLIGAVGLSLSREDFFDPMMWHTIVPVVGILLSLAWWYTTNAYKQVNQVKFAILHCIEAKLPLALYSTEWAIISKQGAKPKHYPSSHIEPVVPWLFMILYLLIFFFIG